MPCKREIDLKGGIKILNDGKRAGSKFIQNGSIPLEEDEGFLAHVSFLKKEDSKGRMISLSQALGEKVSFDWAVECLSS